MTSEEQVNNILNDIEKAELEKFASNQTQFEAVKKVLLMGVYFNGTLEPGKAPNPTLNFALSLVANNGAATNEELGADLRAAFEGLRAVESGFQKLARFKPKKNEVVDNSNPAV